MPKFPNEKENGKLEDKMENAFVKVMESDSSGANVHVVFIKKISHHGGFGGGWALGTGNLCRDTPIAFNCYCETPHCLSEIVTHEIGHVLGNI